MRSKSAGIFCACVLATLAGCATPTGQFGTAASDSLLIMGVSVRRVGPEGRNYSGNHFIVRLSLKNLNTTHVYVINLINNYFITTLPAGVYCLNTISPYLNLTVNYCNTPFFKLDAGKVINAGYFAFTIDYQNHLFKLTKSFSNPQGLYSRLTGTEQAAVKRFIREHKDTSN